MDSISAPVKPFVISTILSAYSLSNSRIMIHQPLGGARGQASDIEIQAREILRLKDITADILSEATGQPVKKVKKDTERDNFMSAQEALEYGIIDKVFDGKRGE